MSDNERKKIVKLNIIISIVIAFIAWVFVVYNYSPMKNVTYKAIPIEFVGEDSLVQTGYGISQSSADTVDVTLSINRTRYNKITANDIQVTADVTNAVEGSNGISLDVTAPSDTAVVKTSITSVSVDVVAGSNKDVEVTGIYTDSTDDSLEPVISNMSYSKVSVFGAIENIEKVCCAAIRLSVNDVSDEPKSLLATPVALDENGKIVKHIIIFPNEISFDAVAGSTKTVKLVVPIRRSSHDDVNEVVVPESVTIKGSTDALRKINSIEAAAIDITGIAESTEIPIDYNLPDGITLARKSIGLSVQVVVK